MRRLFVVLAVCAATVAWAAPGHDHGPQAAGPAAQAAAPRFGTHTDAFELVGVLEGTTLVLYLDRYATNEPVTGARIEIEGDAVKGTAAAAEDGTYRIAADALAAPGKHLMTFTISKDAEADLPGSRARRGGPGRRGLARLPPSRLLALRAGRADRAGRLDAPPAQKG